MKKILQIDSGLKKNIIDFLVKKFGKQAFIAHHSIPTILRIFILDLNISEYNPGSEIKIVFGCQLDGILRASIKMTPLNLDLSNVLIYKLL